MPGGPLRLRFRLGPGDQDRIERWRSKADRAWLWPLYAALWAGLGSALYYGAGLPAHTVVSGALTGLMASCFWTGRRRASEGQAVDVALDAGEDGVELRCGDLVMPRAWNDFAWALITPDGVLLQLRKDELTGIYVPALPASQQRDFEALLRRRAPRLRVCRP